jgi:hypothetical protein
MRGLVMLAVSALATTTGTAATPSTASRIDAGTALVRLIYPPELDEAVMTLTFNAGVAPTYHADPNLRPLEAAHPGLIDAMIAAMRVEYRRVRTAALPTLWARTGAVYARRLDDAELREAIVFHASDAARRIRALEVAAIAKAPPADAGADAIQLYPADPTPVDGVAQGVFNATLVGEKLAAMQAEVRAVNDDWSGKAAPPAATVEAALARVMVRFGAVYTPTAPATSQ